MIKASYIITRYIKLTTGKKDLKDEDRLKILFDIIQPVKYITFNKKKENIVSVIKKTTIFKDGKLFYNSCDRYYEFVCMLLNTYFNLEIEENTFDKLASENILDYLLALISDEYEMFGKMIDSYMNDLENGKIDIESL